MSPGIARTHPRFCLLCSDDYTKWLELPDDDEDVSSLAFEFSSETLRVPPEYRVFANYVKQERGL